jgi:hypothetical protein
VSRSPASRLMRLANWVRTLRARIGSPQRLRIYLSGRSLAACLVQGRFRPMLRAKVIFPFAAPNCGGGDNLPAALAALSEWLHAHPHRGAIEWIIGIDHVRYLFLPWDARLSSKSFCHALAAALFAQQFSGDDIPFSEHQLRFAPLSFGRPRLVALIPSEVVSELTAFASRHHCRSRRIAPALSVVWDSVFPKVKNDIGVLALVEGQRLLRVHYDHGQLISLSIKPCSEAHTWAIPGDVTYLFPPRDTTTPGAELAPQGLAPGDDPRYAYALCGVF